MSFKLTYEKDGDVFERDVNPIGEFSIVTTRNNYRYHDEFSGSMVLMGDDFDWVMTAGRCVEISVECPFRKEFRAVFTLLDCTEINLSKRYLEVIPRSDDEYKKFEPWMKLEMNIIPPYKEIESRVSVLTVNQYEIEKKVIRIDEPYEGFNSENWVGYSLNDWIGTNGIVQSPFYLTSFQNSLIYKLVYEKIEFATLKFLRAEFWLDPMWYELIRSSPEYSNTFISSSELDRLYDIFTQTYWRESFYAIS